VANQKENDEQKNSRSASQDSESQTGDPGRTPGTAEGDEQTVEEDLRQKEGQEQSNK
jgi:hypothetical protein